MRTKQQLIENLSKHYPSGNYWLVDFGNGWYVAISEPKHPEKFIAVEQYHVGSAFINHPAEVTKVNR